MYILEGDEMLIAMADSQLVNATELIRQKTIPKQLVCPCCQQPVIYKHGDRRIAHFSHKSNAICAGFSEGESQAHLKGKLAFKQQLEKMGHAAVLEYHLPTIEQRADVLLPDQQLILEYQCSPISYSDISRRTSNYKSLGYDVLWILGDRHLNAVNRLDGVAKFARFQPRLGFFIVYYSADRRQLKLHYHIQEVAGKVVSSVQFFKSLSDLKRFMDAHETPKQPVSSPFQARQSMLNQLQRIHRSNVLQNPTYRDMVTACYEQGKLFIGCPLICHGKWGEGMPIFKRTILCWRVWVVLQLFSASPAEISNQRLNQIFVESVQQFGQQFAQVDDYVRFFQMEFKSFIFSLRANGYLRHTISGIRIVQSPTWFESYDQKRRIMMTMRPEVC